MLKRVWIPSPNFASGSSARRLIVIHTTEGARTYQELGAFFGRVESQASSHVGIDDTPGTVGEYVRPRDTAWTVAAYNPISMNAELCAFASWSREAWMQQHKTMLDNCGLWIAEEAAALGIPIVRLSPSQAQGNGRGVCGHVDLGSSGGGHHDPGSGFPWDYVMDVALHGIPTPSPTPPPVVQATPYPFTLLGEDAVPEYLLNATNPQSVGGGWYAAYSNGVVRKIGSDELSFLQTTIKGLPVVEVTQQDPGTRLYRMDQALRGYVEVGGRTPGKP